MAATPSFISTPRLSAITLSTANTAYDGTGTIATLIQGVAAGTRVLEVTIQSVGTSAAAVVNLFVSLDNGTTWRLFDTVTISAVTASTTTAPFRITETYTNLILPNANARLGATVTVSQATTVAALGGDLT
jgi:hypothetical protein